jgi:hypothetical protein
MSYQQPKIETFTAEADLSTHQYKLVKYGTAAKGLLLCGAGEKAIGVLMNAPKLGEIAEVSVAGGALVKIASTVAVNASIGSGASGVGAAAGAAGFALGIARAAGVTGDVIEIQIDRHYVPA